jgi:class 3 adenylate cyclase/tetratricopeptide (TPR) repeat protein
MRRQRRHVTVLSADVNGSTALSERLDPEDVVEIVGEAVRLMCEAVEELGGTIKDIAGDGVLALFGAPAAGENDPERAVLAGLLIQRRMAEHAEEMSRTHGLGNFGVRVGVESGLVVTGPVGGGGRIEYGATGDAVNTAARLQSEASVGEVLVGPETRRQVTERFIWGPPLRLDLKGISGAVRATPALRWAGSSDGDRVDPPLIGRDDELAVCLERVRRLSNRPGGSVLVVGDPGMGKTRLLNAVRTEAVGRNLTWLEGRCTASDRTTPFAGIRDLFGRWLGASPDLVDALVDRVGVPRSRAEEMARSIAVLFGAEDREQVELSPVAIQLRTVEGAVEIIERMSATAPAVVALEDLQWADHSTILTMERLGVVARTDPVLLLTTRRTDDGDPPSSDTSGSAASEGPITLALGPLRDGSDRLLLESLAGAGTLPADIERRILYAAEGNPLYIREFVRAMEESTDKTMSVVAAPPPSLDRLILSRIDSLDQTTAATLSSLSVLGRTFAPELGRSVSDDPPDLAIGTLMDRGFLLRDGSHLSFSHALVHEVAYSTLLLKRRRELHRRAAEEIEGSPDAYDAVQLARHWQEAGESTLALRFHLEAADAAEAVSALHEALEHVDAAVHLSAEAGVSDGATGSLLLRRAGLEGRTGAASDARSDAEHALRIARDDGDLSLELEALEELGSVLAGAVDYRVAVPIYERAHAIGRRLNDRAGLARTEAHLSIAWTNLLRFDLALEHGRRALELAEGRNDEGLTATALDALKQVELDVGDFDPMETHTRSLMSILEGRGDLWHLQIVFLERSVVRIAKAEWSSANTELARGLAINRRLGDAGNEPLFELVLGWQDRLEGRYDDALTRGRHSFDIARGRGHAEWTAFAGIQLAATMVDVGDLVSSIPVLEIAVEEGERAHAGLHSVRARARLALLRHRIGDLAKANDDLDHARMTLASIVAPPGGAHVLGWDAYADAGRLMARMGDPAAALELTRPVLDAVKAGPFFEAIAGLELGRAEAFHALGDDDGELAAANAAMTVAEETGLPGLAWRAHAVLASMPAPGREQRSHAERARSIVSDLTGLLREETMRRSLETEVSRVMGGEPWSP